MKIVITALGKELTSKTDPKFGRAKYHLIYNLDNDEFEVIDNEENMKRMGGAGIQAAENVVAKVLNLFLQDIVDRMLLKLWMDMVLR